MRLLRGLLRRHRAAGLLVADERRLRLTERGVLLSNEVFQALI